ncbi:hypothetical protein GYMLUDRAFT_257835 [Collybiopsis luxurians FD-317 M1]|nr:hypothetical protein GYMLUDRAFT_257835 [Collybiopsis luxurians FD-317 M1]
MPKCYKDGQFLVHPPHSVFALHHASRTSFSPDPLCLRPIFVWLPEYLPGHPDHFKCRCGGNLTMNGYNDNPIARHVHTSTGTDYFLFTNRYLCDSRRANNRGCGTSYQGSDPHVLDQLPQWVQEAFPAYLTTRGAVDKLVIDQMKPCFTGQFGPEPFLKMLHELQMLQHSRQELMYLSAATSYGLSGLQVPRFPSFDDPMKYAGSSPSVRYLKCIWTDYHAVVKIYLDRIQASLSGFKLAGDHTFRIMKALARLKSEPIFSALFSVINEWEEIWAQAMGLTKGFSVLPEMFEQVKKGLEEHGHQPTNIYYCDNPSAECDFHEHVMESLKDNVVHIPHTASRTEHDTLRYPYLMLPSTSRVEFFSTFMLINNACESILEAVEALNPADTLVVALSVSYTVQRSLYSIQLRTSDKIFVFKIANLTPGKIPLCLRSVLTSSHIIKIGHSIVPSILCIATALNMPDLMSIASENGPFLDLGKLAKVKGAVQDAYAPLNSLALTVLKQRLPELPDISLPAPIVGSKHWSRTSALHIDTIWQIYLSLIQCNSVGLHLHPSETQVGQLVTLVASCKEVVEGIILDHNGKVEVVMDETGNTTQLKITPAYSLIQITRMLVPGSISLLGRSLPVSGNSEDNLLPSNADNDEDEDREGEDDSYSYYSDDDNDIGRDFDDDDPEPTPEELIVNSLQEAQDLLTQPQGSLGILASHVLDDAFYFMDHLLRTFPKKHSAFKEFAHQFSKTIFDYIVRAKKSWLNRHVRHYIPPPTKLEADLKLLFDSFKNIESTQVSNSLLDTVHCGFLSDPPNISLYYITGWDCDKLPLYCTIRGTNSIEGAVHMLIRRIFGSLKASPELAVALLSNWILRRNQRVGHFNRTGQKWSNHFDIWLLDEITELAIYLDMLPSFRLPRMLATRIATSESFGIMPIPSALAEEYHISTLPAHRIEGLPHHHDTPVHLLTWLSMKITNPYRYLQLTQRTVFPVIPVHTRKEYTEFKCLLASDNIHNNRANAPITQPWKGINYIKFAKLWNILVDTQDATITDPNERLYYKLPEQLLRHHKRLLEWQASRATILDGSNAAMIHDHLNLLQNPERVASVLPAVALEDLDTQPDPTAEGIRGLDLTSFNPMALVRHDTSGCTYSDGQYIATETSGLTDDNPGSNPITHIAAGMLQISTENWAEQDPNMSTDMGTYTPANNEESHKQGTAHMQTILTFNPSGPGEHEQPFPKKQRIESGPKRRAACECAVCAYHWCPRASVCSGRGGRDKCYGGVCKHENIGKHRVRRS